MELHRGFRITLVSVLLALTLSGEPVEAQRAGKTIRSDITFSRAHVDCVCD